MAHSTLALLSHLVYCTYSILLPVPTLTYLSFIDPA